MMPCQLRHQSIITEHIKLSAVLLISILIKWLNDSEYLQNT